VPVGRVAGEDLLRLRLEVEIDRVAATAQRFGHCARRDMYPGLAGFATKAIEKRLEGRYHRLEILLSEIGPLVVVDGFVDGPLLDARCAGCGGQGSLPLCHGFLLSVLSPRLGG